MRKKTAVPRRRRADFQRERARPVRAGRTSRMVRLLIADSQELIRLGLRAMLAGESGLSIRGEVGTLAEVVEEARRMRPDLVLLDSHLLDGSGADACQLLLKEHAAIRIVIMTQDQSTAVLRKVRKAGAHGVVHKGIRQAELLQAIRQAASGDAKLNSAGMNGAPSVLGRDDKQIFRSQVSRLSPQERRILPLITEGKTNHEIALELTLAKVTVKNYIANMFRKLNISRRTQAAAVYLQAQSCWTL